MVKAKVVNVENITFTNGTQSHKIFAITEDHVMGCFYTTKDCKVGDIFQLSIVTDNKQQFAVKKDLLSQ